MGVCAQRVDAAGEHWTRVQLSSAKSTENVRAAEWQRFRAPEEFGPKRSSVVEPGATIVVTAGSLKPGTAVTMLVSEGPSQRPAADPPRRGDRQRLFVRARNIW